MQRLLNGSYLRIFRDAKWMKRNARARWIDVKSSAVR
jgi:hypothetical protein